MSETMPPLPEPDIEPLRRRGWPSVVWLVPIAAVLGAVFLLVENVATRGPLITISFGTASGLKAGESVVRYRDIDVGRVEAIRFAPDLTSVLVEVRMDKAVAPYLDDSASFWIVRPEVSAQGITGLETVISGTYIEGTWDTEPGQTKDVFAGTERPPPTPEGTPGLRIKLNAADGSSLEIGSPVLFKGLEVGKIEEKRLSDDGNTVEFEAFIHAPNDRHVTEATRFWNASGVDLQLGSEGARLRIASLASLLRGGASFSNFGAENAARARSGQVFDLFSSESDAAENVSTGDMADAVRLQVSFTGSVRGLRPGASVEYRGFRVGRVLEVTAAIDPANGVFRTNTIVGLSPTLLGLEETDRESLLRFLAGAIANGLRAKLALGNLLTGSLYVNLDDDAAATATAFDPTLEIPVLPSMASDIDELTGSVEGILKRVDALPIEALLANAVALLENVNRIAADENTREIPVKVLSVLAAAEALVAKPELGQTADEAKALVGALRAIAEDPALKAVPAKLDATLGSLAVISAELEKGNAAADLSATIAALRVIAEAPELKLLPGQVDKALTAANTLLGKPELGQTVDEARALVVALRAIAEDPALESAPEKLTTMLASLAEITTELQKRNTAADLAATIAALRVLAESPELRLLPEQALRALASLATILEQPAAKDIPGQIVKTLALVRKALDLPGLNEVPADLRQTLASVRARLDDPALTTALQELTPLLAETRAAIGGVSTRSDEVLKSLNEILNDPGIKAAPADISATLKAARKVLEDPTLQMGLGNATTEAAATLAALRKILEDPRTRAAPGELAETLASARVLLKALEEANAAENLSRSLAAAQRLLEDPALTRVSGELATTLEALRAVLATDGAKELPAALVVSLNSASALIDQFQRQNVAGSAVGALNGVRAVTRAAERSLTGVPALIKRLSTVSKRADSLLASVAVGSQLNYETVTAIREIRDAARAITDLVDLVQRRPNAIILGK